MRLANRYRMWCFMGCTWGLGGRLYRTDFGDCEGLPMYHDVMENHSLSFGVEPDTYIIVH